MKAMRLHQPEPVERSPLRLEEVPDPPLSAGQIAIRVHVCGVCRTDLHIAEGELDPHRMPIIPGHQVVGTVIDRAPGADRFAIGDRVGIAWLHRACGACDFCIQGPDRENLCRNAAFTGWTVDGGYAEIARAPEAFAYPIPDVFSDEEVAPLLCAGIIGYRALRITGIRPGQRLGLYGFGASAHIAIQIATHWGCEVRVFTRSPDSRALAHRLGAAWTGTSQDDAPAKLDAAIMFAPAGQLVLHALESLEKGGTLALAGIYMSPIPELDYLRHLYDEKVIRSVANATRADGDALLETAARIPVRTITHKFPLVNANEALVSLKSSTLSGAIVLDCRT